MIEIWFADRRLVSRGLPSDDKQLSREANFINPSLKRIMFFFSLFLFIYCLFILK